ncbi:MAG: helix-turn-helix domain-containing protein [Syntrophales bacterium]|nr:helix-turn-helix domain-containing protein [Syntrophales bacterium]
MYITEKEVSVITQRALSTLRNDRFKGRGIAYCKIGRSVRYSRRDVIDFMETRKITTSSERSTGIGRRGCMDKEQAENN